MILTCAMCLSPFSLVHAQGEAIASIPTSCKDGDHVGYVSTETVGLGDYGYDLTVHWEKLGNVVKCRGCQIELQIVDLGAKGPKQSHTLRLGHCIICGGEV